MFTMRALARPACFATSLRFASAQSTPSSDSLANTSHGAVITPMRERTWAWGSKELNQLSFVQVAKDYDAAVKAGIDPPVKEFSGHPHVWSIEDVESVQITHKQPHGIADHIAYRAVRLCRWGFDTFSLYRFGKLTEGKVVNRCLFLETIAGVPGMVGGMLRHMTSLRRMERDNGWIHTLLDEAENERMHLMTFIELRKPGIFFRLCIIAAQGIMFNLLFFLYLVSPRFVHRFVGYLEEEAVITYTSIIDHIAQNAIKIDDSRIPSISKQYWDLKDKATFYELIQVIRADEAEHRVVNHTFADMHLYHLQQSPNPFVLIQGHDKKA